MNDRTTPILPSACERRAEPLDAQALRLLGTLPATHRPGVLQRHFPHVVNRIAAEWPVPPRMLVAFDELLVDGRGSRSGFPFEAALELMRLREYYVETLHPELQREPNGRDPDAWR